MRLRWLCVFFLLTFPCWCRRLSKCLSQELNWASPTHHASHDITWGCGRLCLGARRIVKDRAKDRATEVLVSDNDGLLFIRRLTSFVPVDGLALVATSHGIELCNSITRFGALSKDRWSTHKHQLLG